MEGFKKLAKIDAHVHFNKIRNPLFSYGREQNFCFLSINTDMPLFPVLEEQQQANLRSIATHGKQLHFVTSFSCDTWAEGEWQKKTIDKLKKSIELGARGVKVWKNIGMSLKDNNGRYVSIDHPKFDPIFHFLAENDIVLLGHIGEPKNCWLPLEKMTVASDRSYFAKNPEYHMFLHRTHLAYEQHLNARDHMLKKHPKLRYVGLHLASQEWDTTEVALFLDEFPNTMVDLAERICHLQYQAISDWQKVYDFMVAYQDRIIYGTDCIDDGSLSDTELVNLMDNRYRMHWKFFTGSERMSAPKVAGQFRGLGLPFEVLEKIYNTNAARCYGI